MGLENLAISSVVYKSVAIVVVESSLDMQTARNICSVSKSESASS